MNIARYMLYQARSVPADAGFLLLFPGVACTFLPASPIRPGLGCSEDMGVRSLGSP